MNCSSAYRIGRSIIAPISDAIFPQSCLGCGTRIPGFGGSFCESCQNRIEVMRAAPYCPKCARTMPEAAIELDGCRFCRDDPTWTFAEVVRVGPYESPLSDITLAIKYRGDWRAAEFAATVLSERLRRSAWFPNLQALIPVPMHRLRRLQRPHDHALLLTSLLSRNTGVPAVQALRRVRYSRSQTEQESKARRVENVRDCFAPMVVSWRKLSAPNLAGNAVCIVDNLAASGATLHECAKALRTMGVRRLYAAIMTRATVGGDVQAAADTVLPP